ncbi:MAG: tetratricopeptide repeat protein [Candidatus Omnitrophota bacterium]|nr:tetratricopeptide repeat protein [Candidatus Omnitrophota bacterium]
MKRNIWSKVNYVLGLFSVLILFCLIILHANNEVKDLDLWLHLKTGEYIVQNKCIPDKDIFSFSIAGRPWINHEWLFQIIAYLFYNKWGIDGLISMQVFVVVITFMILLFLGYKRHNHFKIVLGLLLVLLVYRTRFTIRPDIFSLLFFSLYLYMLSNYIHKKAISYVLPLIQILWVNSHGFFSLGIIIIFLYMLAEFIKRQFKLPWRWNENKLSDIDYRRLKILFLLVFLASFANPYTFKGVMYPFQVLGELAGKSRIFFEHIQELKPSMRLKNIFELDYLVYYKLLIIFSALSFYFNRKKININLLLIWLLFLPMSIVAIRNIVFFAFVAYAVFIISLEQIEFGKILPLTFREEKLKYVTKAMFGILLIVCMFRLGNAISGSGYYVFDNYELKSSFRGLSQRAYPQRAIDFILENKITGNIFNDFNSGAFLIGKCFPQIKVFIDGRTEVYGPDFFNNYRKMLDNDMKLLDKTLEKFNVDTVLLSSVFHQIPAKILKHLYRDHKWRLVFFDEYAVIFLKNIPENKQLIEKFRIDLDRWLPSKVDLLKLGPRKIYPYININRAYTLNSLALDNQVLKEISEALKIMPNCAEAYSLAGDVYSRENSWDKAFENFRLASAYLPSNAQVRSNLGLAYSKLNDIESAIKQFDLAIKSDPNYTNSYYYLARIQMDSKNHKAAIHLLEKAVKIEPKEIKYLVALADALFQEKKFVDVCKVYQKALEIEPENSEIHTKLAKCYLEIGLTKEAKRQYEKILEIDPQSKEARKQLMKLKSQELQEQ